MSGYPTQFLDNRLFHHCLLRDGSSSLSVSAFVLLSYGEKHDFSRQCGHTHWTALLLRSLFGGLSLVISGNPIIGISRMYSRPPFEISPSFEISPFEISPFVSYQLDRITRSANGEANVTTTTETTTTTTT